MKRSIDRIDPMSAAKIMGIMYLVLGALFFPFIMLSVIFGGEFGFGLVTGLLFGIFMLLMYGVMGFLGAALMSWLYNVVAPRVGGIEVEVSERQW